MKGCKCYFSPILSQVLSPIIEESVNSSNQVLSLKLYKTTVVMHLISITLFIVK